MFRQIFGLVGGMTVPLSLLICAIQDLSWWRALVVIILISIVGILGGGLGHIFGGFLDDR